MRSRLHKMRWRKSRRISGITREDAWLDLHWPPLREGACACLCKSAQTAGRMPVTMIMIWRVRSPRARTDSTLSTSRGDTKPCSIAGCAGMMRFARRSDNDPETALAGRPMDLPDPAMDQKGWVCNVDPDHFRQEGS